MTVALVIGLLQLEVFGFGVFARQPRSAPQASSPEGMEPAEGVRFRCAVPVAMRVGRIGHGSLAKYQERQ